MAVIRQRVRCDGNGKRSRFKTGDPQMKITSDLLRSKKACEDQVKLFESLFPGGTEITEDLCVKHASQFDWKWASRNLLNKKQREAYLIAITPAMEAYHLAIAPAEAAYHLAMASAMGAYNLAMLSAREAYLFAMASAREVYDLVTAPAMGAYDLAMASAFARAFLNRI